jgi:hypothetical protein
MRTGSGVVHGGLNDNIGKITLRRATNGKSGHRRMLADSRRTFSSDNPRFSEREVRRFTTQPLTNDDMIQEVDLEDPRGLINPTCYTFVSLRWVRIP